MDALLDALATNDRAQVQAANAALTSSLHALGLVVARPHWPVWLAELTHHAANYDRNHSNGIATWKAHLLTLMKHRNEVEQWSWFSDPEEALGFDPDDIIDQARSAQKIDELFSRLVELLTSLAKSGELDSVRACEDLKKIIKILQRSRSGSFTSQVITWQFTRSFIPNLISCYLKRSDVTGPIIEAFEQTSEELDLAFSAARDDVAGRLLTAVRGGFRSEAAAAVANDDIQALPRPKRTIPPPATDTDI